MAFQYRGVGTAANGNNSAGPLSPTLPSGVVEGDLLVVQFQCFGGTNSRVPSIASPWTSYVWSNGTANHLIAWKIAGASESNPSITLTGTGATNDTQVSRCFAFYSDDATKAVQFDSAGTDSTNASADNIGPITGVTVPTGGGLVLISAGKTNDFNGQGSLTSWTQAALTESTTGSDAGMSLLYRLATPAGATGNLTVTDSGATASDGLGFGKMLVFVEVTAPITGTGTADVGLTVSATGTATPPAITGSGTVEFGLTASADGTVTAPSSPLVARGTIRPVRSPRHPRLRARRPNATVLTAPATVAPITATGAVTFGVTVSGSGTVVPPTITGTGSATLGLTVTATGEVAPPGISGSASVSLGLTVSATGDVVAPPITGDGTVSFGLTVTATGTTTADTGLTGRGLIRPIRARRDPRTRVRTAPQLLARVSQDVAGEATVSFGLTVAADGTVGTAVTGTGVVTFGLTTSGTGTASPPAITGTASTTFGVTVTGTGTATPPPITGTGTALLGVTVSATGTVTPPAYTGTGSVSLGLTVTATGSVQPPLTGAATALFGLTVTASGIMDTGLGPGLIRAEVTWTARHGADVTIVVRHPGAITYLPRHDADLTHVARHDASFTYVTKD